MKRWKENISDMLELPKDTFMNLPQIIMLGNKEIYIDNYKGIIEYSDTVIRLNIGEKALKICGENLDIKGIGEEDITIDGSFCSVEFL